jgi:hypothetical protein
MRLWVLLATLLTFASFAATAEAHTCTADDCGDCQEGNHVHNYANGTLFCESIGEEKVPGPNVVLVIAALACGALAASYRKQA